MATRYFTGDAGAAQGLNYTRTVPLSGGSALSNIRIDSVIAYAFMSTNAYTNTYQVRARLLDSVGATLAEVTRTDIKFNSSNYTGATWEFNFGTAFDQNAIASISFFGLNEASKIFVKSTQSVAVNYTPITACTPPSSISLSASMAAPGGAVTLSWSGAGAGSANPIVGYIIQRSEKGGAWSNWKTDNASPYAVTAHPTWGSYYDYRIITDGQYIDSSASTSVRLTTYTPTTCGAPTSASVAPSLCESDPTLSASGATGGTINAITGYEIQYAESANGTTYGAWTALKTVSTTGASLSTAVTLPSVRAYSRKYRLRTLGAAGASYYSGWKETNAVKRNSLPTAPTSFTAAPEVYVSGAIALTYSGAADPDGNLSTHNIQYATKSGVEAWSAWANLTNGITAHTPTLSPGQSIKYRVRAVDALGVVSDWLESNSCVKNTAPAAPTVNYPQAGKTTHNSRPRLLVTIGADPEGHTQRLVSDDFMPSRADGLTAGAKIVLRRTSAAGAGTVGYSIKSADQYNEESTAKTGSLTYTAPSFTDATITGGTTRIKAAHMTELREMVEDVRAYYGLGENLFSEINPGTLLSLYGVTATETVNVCAESPTGTCVDLSNITRTAGNYVWYLPLKTLVPLFGTEVKTYTISFWIKANNNQTLEISPNSMSLLNTSTTSIATAYNLVTVTVGVSALNADNYNFHVSLVGAGLTDVSIYGIKIECGSVATSWTNNSVHWGELITAGVTKSRGWKAHVAELRAAINDVVTLVNGWDTESTVNRVPALNWVTLAEKPSAEVMNQLRQVIAWL